MADGHGGCDYGQANRMLINNFVSTFETWKQSEFVSFRREVMTKLDRPSWFVTSVIAILSSACLSMAVYIITRS